MKKILSILMVMVLTLSVSMTAFAAEEGESNQELKRTVEEKVVGLMSEESIREVEIELTEKDMKLLTKEEAIAAGFSEEEIRGKNIYEVQTEYNGSLPSHMYSGDVGYEDVTASSTFTGAGHTLHGNQVILGFSKKSGDATLVVGFYSYNSNWNGQGVCYESDTYGNNYRSGWKSIYPNETYYFKYWIWTTSTDLTNQVPVKFRVLLGVV